ncbi:4-oxalocrotonate tautomerase DmpI [Methanospirillum lacunae]|uniref:4-oxalocrotonate tautomerase n=1 Tax=Methanospirillum lacunae TaxID=668570 RepID=A0A2V2N677_9EURY|nr:4-oxalocrotonate tautomerase DmpI [Methanospirillum lacunae]PWR74100.1 4-oxalocrotonate tautomerase [Methanospirillum lacunae]
MPVISVEIGPLTSEVKEELIKTLTKTASSITKIPESSFIVLVKEYPADAIGVGGIPLSKR